MMNATAQKTDAATPTVSGLLQHQQVAHTPISDLQPARTNPRTHSPGQIKQIAASIEQFGFINPILIDGNHHIIAGHGRLAAARLLDLEAVPTLQLAHLTPAEQRAYVIADNRLAELAGWDQEILANELLDLATLELDFDIQLTGFATAEIDVMIGELAAEESEPEAPPPEPEPGPAITRPGDLWQVGPHRLLCADSMLAESYEQLLEGEQAQLVFTDPPYNVPVDGHVCGLGAVQHKEFAMASGEMSQAEFTAFLETVCGHLAAHSQAGAIHFVCMDWRHLPELLAAGNSVYTELKNLCVWAKTNGGMGSLYRSQHELVLVYKVGSAPHINNVELGKHGRYRTNVWNHAGINTLGAERDEALAWHPTVKPVALVADAIQDCSHRGGIVLDAFAGSGTTLVAAAATGRIGYGLELEPRYCDVILKRLADATGETPRHAASGQTFMALAAKRQVEAA